MFERVINDAASRLNVPNASLAALVRGILSLMTSEGTGGTDGFIDMFRRAGLGDVVTSWFGGNVGKPITAPQVESALGEHAIDKLGASSGLTRANVLSALTFLLPKLIGKLTPGGVMPSTSALLSQVSSFMDRTGVTLAEHTKPRKGLRWLPWAAAALLALAALLWARGTPGTIEPQLTLTNTDGRVMYSGLVRDESTRTAIISALRTTFGADNVVGDVRVDRNVKRAAWLPRLGEVLAALKTPGVEFALLGDTVNVGGWLSEADRERIASRLGGIVGPEYQIETLTDPAADAARAANDRAMSALDAVRASNISDDALVQALNLAIINFPTGSDRIPDESIEVIRRSAEAIRSAPAGSQIEIGGHTDNVGDPDSNLSLSQARAEAVKRAMVDAGAPAESLVAKGYGDSRPRATNDTEYGRFQNRRIEYTVVR